MVRFGLAAGRFDIYNKDFPSYYLVNAFPGSRSIRVLGSGA